MSVCLDLYAVVRIKPGANVNKMYMALNGVGFYDIAIVPDLSRVRKHHFFSNEEEEEQRVIREVGEEEKKAEELIEQPTPSSEETGDFDASPSVVVVEPLVEVKSEAVVEQRNEQEQPSPFDFIVSARPEQLPSGSLPQHRQLLNVTHELPSVAGGPSKRVEVGSPVRTAAYRMAGGRKRGRDSSAGSVVECQLCGTTINIEKRKFHMFTHCSRHRYGCPVPGCRHRMHQSCNMTRHIRETHGIRDPAVQSVDLIDDSMRDEWRRMSQLCYPHIDGEMFT